MCLVFSATLPKGVWRYNNLNMDLGISYHYHHNIGIGKRKEKKKPDSHCDLRTHFSLLICFSQKNGHGPRPDLKIEVWPRGARPLDYVMVTAAITCSIGLINAMSDK